MKAAVFEIRPKYSQAISKAPQLHISANPLKEKHPLFSKLSFPTVQNLINLSEVLQLSNQDELYRKGEPDSRVFFCLFGRVDLTFGSGVG